jgi:hypothetical protein
MAEPHRYDVARVATLRPDHQDHAIAEPSNGDLPRLSVADLVPVKSCGLANEYLGRIGGEVDAPLAQGDLTFGRVEADFCWQICNYGNARSSMIYVTT